MIFLLALSLLLAPAVRAAVSPATSALTAVAQSLQTLELPPDVDLPPVSTPGSIEPGGEADLTTRCETLKTPIKWSYCISRDKKSASHEVLYYLHGLGGDEKAWAFGNRPLAIRAVWKSKDKPLPIAVAISFGPFWLLADKNSSAYSGLMNFVTDYAIPYIEKQKLESVPSKRLLMGESMGGFNATEMVLKFPQMFERAAIVCPAIVNASPYSSADEFDRYVKRTGADPDYVRRAVQLSQAVFPDEASWETAAPLLIGKTRLGKDTPPLHVSCGDKDQYGFFEGAKAFADLARSNGVDVVWQPLPGGHCAGDPVALANFLIP